MAADGSVVIQITGDDKEFKKSLGALGGVAESALRGVTTAVTIASAAIAGMAAGAAKVGSAFESSLAATSTMFGDVAVDTDELTAQILELSSATGLASTEISSSLYNALSAGIPVTEDMTGAMEYMESAAKLAAAGFTDVDTAVTATAKVMNAYGMGLDEVDKIQTIMLQTQNKGITTVNELGATLAQVTPTAAAMGVSFENVGAALATMTAQGTPTAQATTQLNALIAELGKNGTVAAKNLDAATKGTEYAGKGFTELMNAGVPLNEVLDLVAAHADDSGLSMIDMFSSIEAGKAALAMAGDNSGKFADNLAAMSTEADVVGEAYAKVTDTLEHRIGVLKESVSNLGIAVYDGMKDPLKGAAGMATNWIGQITKGLAKGGLEGAVGAVGNVLAEAITYIARLAPQMIDAGVTLLQALLSGISDNLPALSEGAVGIITSLINGIATLLPSLAVTALQMIASLVAGIAASLPALVPAAIGAVMTLVQGILDNLPALIEAGIVLIVGLAEGVIESIPILISAIPLLIEAISNTLIGNIDKLVLVGFQLFVALIRNLPAIIASIVSAVPQIVSAIVSAFGDLFGEVVEIGVHIVEGVWQGIKSMAKWLADKVKGFFGGIVDGIKNTLGINSPSVVVAKEIGRPTAQGVVVGFEDEIQNLSRKMKSAVDLELAKVSVSAALQAENVAIQGSVVKEVYKDTKTIEKVAQIEGDGLTGDLIRMLGLRLKEDQSNRGFSFAD